MTKTTARTPKTKPARDTAKKNPAAHIMSAPKGYRTLSHRQIKAAVDKVFRERAAAGK